MPERASKERALAGAMRQGGGADRLHHAETTAAGLVSLPARLAPVADLGIFGGLAVIVVLGVALIVVPLAFRLFRFAPAASGDATQPAVVTQARVARLAATRLLGARSALSATVTLIAALGLQGLRFHHNSLEWLPRDNAVRQARPKRSMRRCMARSTSRR